MLLIGNSFFLAIAIGCCFLTVFLTFGRILKFPRSVTRATQGIFVWVLTQKVWFVYTNL